MSTADAHMDRSLIQIHVTASARRRYDAFHHVCLTVTPASVSVITAECANRHSNSAIDLASVSALGESTAPVERFSATRYVTVFAARN